MGAVLDAVRRLWKLLRLSSTMAGYSLHVSLAARRRPPAARAAFRAERQQAGCRALCRIFGITVKLPDEVPHGQAMLLVCNHFGVLDPLVLATVVRASFVSKAEVQGWPFFGWVAGSHGVIFVERERPTQASTFVQQVRARLLDGVHVLVFPEGTTSAKPRVLPFKTGAFAAVAGMEDGGVLPLYLDALQVDGVPAQGAARRQVVWADTDQSFGAHIWQLLGLRSIEMVVRVGMPVSTEDHDRKALARMTHEQVVALAPGHRKGTPRP